MFFVLLLVAATGLVTTAVRSGPRLAAIWAFALSALLPCWCYADIGAVRIDIRTALALVGIGCAYLHPQSTLRPRLLMTDLFVCALAVVVLAAEALSDVVTMTVAADAALQWIVPYWLGRIVLGNEEDVDRLAEALVPACVLLSAWAVIESVLRLNPLGILLGHVGSMQSMYDLRWGLRRAEGPLTHPIFFGLHLVMLLPFALAAARKARDGGRAWHRWLPWIVAIGACFTLSRGPQMGVLLTAALTTAVLLPRWRPMVVAPLVGIVLIGAMAGELFIDLLHHWSGEQSMIIEIHGESVPYSGTLHRLLQLRVYAEAVDHAGWLGYGTLPLRAGKNTVPFVQEDLRQMFSSIDNHYLQFVLQCGHLGLILFLLLPLTAIVSAWRVAACTTGSTRVLAAALGGALVALVLLMSSVWLASDYRFLLLAVIGMAGGLKQCCARRWSTQSEAAPVAFVSLSPSPGYLVSPL